MQEQQTVTRPNFNCVDALVVRYPTLAAKNRQSNTAGNDILPNFPLTLKTPDPTNTEVRSLSVDHQVNIPV